MPVHRQALIRQPPYMNLFKKLKTIFSQTPKDEGIKKDFNQVYEDNGRFTYDDDGFVFQFSDLPQKIFWSEIDRMTAYKVDLITIDELRLDIEFRGLTLPISEETPGFFQFVLKTKEVFTTIANDWDLKIIHPAFEANKTVIYEKKQGDASNSG